VVQVLVHDAPPLTVDFARQAWFSIFQPPTIDILIRIITIRNTGQGHNTQERRMIVSTVNGRVRVRARALRSGKEAARIAAELADLPGVVDARPNAGAGCLVVNFDPDAIDVGMLEERIEKLLLRPALIPF